MAERTIKVKIAATSDTARAAESAVRDFKRIRDAERPSFGPSVRPRFGEDQQFQRFVRAEQLRQQRSDERLALRVNRGEISSGEHGRFGLSGATQRRLQESQISLYRQIKQATDGLENFGKILKGVGAAGVIAEIGEKLQELPATIGKYRDSLSVGANKTTAFAAAISDNIPIIGKLAYGFRAILDLPKQLEEEKRKAKEEAQIELAGKKHRGEQRRDDAVNAARAAGASAEERMRLAGLEGPDRAIMAAQIEYEKKQKEANDIAFTAKGLASTKAQDEIKRQAQRVRDAAEADRQAEFEKAQGEKNRRRLEEEQDAREQQERARQESADREAEERQRLFEGDYRRLQDVNNAKEALNDFMKPRFNFHRSNGLAEAMQAGSLTGVADDSRRRAMDDPVFKEQKDQTKYLKLLYDVAEKTLAYNERTDVSL